MSFVFGIFFMEFNQPTFLVIDFLIEPNGFFLGADFFDVTCLPAQPSEDFYRVTPPAIR